MKIRPPSACNPARFARHCLARVTRELSVRLLARERCGIRARCVRVLDARSFARGGRRVRSCVRSFASVVANGTARVQRLEEPSSSSARRRRRGGRRRRRTRRTKTKKASVRVATTRRGGRRAGTRRRRRRRDDEGTRGRDSRLDAFVVATTRGCIDAHVFMHSFMHAFESNASVGAFFETKYSKFECI